MRRPLLALLAMLAVTASLLPVWAESPVPVEEVAPIEDLVLETKTRVAELEEALATEESYEELKEVDVWMAFGVLACMGQAIAEHPAAGETEIAGASLREAARRFRPELTYAEAKAALEAVKAAASGETSDTANVEHDWANLIDMYTMMEEIEARNRKLVRVARRPRGEPEEPTHASTIAVLTVAMMADTTPVLEPADVPVWKEMSREYQQLMTRLASAIRKQDRRAARTLIREATVSCNRCHRKFRD